MAKDMLTFDAGDLSDDQLMTVMAVANVAKARMDAVEKGCKAVLVGRMETGHQPAMLDGEELADIQRTAGGGGASGEDGWSACPWRGRRRDGPSTPPVPGRAPTCPHGTCPFCR